MKNVSFILWKNLTRLFWPTQCFSNDTYHFFFLAYCWVPTENKNCRKVGEIQELYYHMSVKENKRKIQFLLWPSNRLPHNSLGWVCVWVEYILLIQLSIYVHKKYPPQY